MVPRWLLWGPLRHFSKHASANSSKQQLRWSFESSLTRLFPPACSCPCRQNVYQVFGKHLDTCLPKRACMLDALPLSGARLSCEFMFLIGMRRANLKFTSTAFLLQGACVSLLVAGVRVLIWEGAVQVFPKGFGSEWNGLC